MTNNEFKIWLTGYFDLENPDAVLSAKQLWIIHNHLQLTLAVSGELDDKNNWLKSHLEGLYKATPSPFMSMEFKKVTQQLRKWMACCE